MENRGGSAAHCGADLFYPRGRADGQWIESPTCSLSNVQHVADDLLGVLQRLSPRHLDGGGRDCLSLHALWGTWQPICPQDSQASAGLRGAGAILGDALVDGFICLVDPIDG